jgi:hypothetical protein
MRQKARHCEIRWRESETRRKKQEGWSKNQGRCKGRVKETGEDSQVPVWNFSGWVPVDGVKFSERGVGRLKGGQVKRK